MWRQCTNCKKILPLYFFAKKPGGKFGVASKCKECIRIYARAYHKKNREKENARSKKWYGINGEEHNERNKTWQRNNPGRVKEISKDWRKNNPEKVKESSHKRRLLKFNSEGWHTEDEWELLKKLSSYRCLCCGKEVKLEQDHIIPLSEGGTDYIDNIQPLCRSCNATKHTKIIDYRPIELQELILEHFS